MSSNRFRDFITVIMIIFMAATAFGAGYLARDLGVLGESRRQFSEDDESFGVFWEAWSKVQQNFIGEIPEGRVITYAALEGSFGTLEDPYTFFVEPEDHAEDAEELRGNFGGVGAYVTMDDDGNIVLTPIPDNPAEAAGIVEGDILIAVDGRTVTPDDTIEQISELVRGEIGTEVTLTVIHPGQSRSVDITITRQAILQPSVDFRVVAEEPAIGYIRLFRFSGESAGEVEEALATLTNQSVQGIILDVRRNPGGLLSAAVDISDLFLEGGPILYQKSRAEEEKVFMATDDTLAPAIPLVVLIDGSSASASEIVAGALHDRNRATLIGETTFGKGSVQLVHELSDGSAVHVTSARWFTPDRHQIDQFGLEPDIPVELSHENAGSENDAAVQAAIDFLQN